MYFSFFTASLLFKYKNLEPVSENMHISPHGLIISRKIYFNALLVLLIEQLISTEHHLCFYYSTLHIYSQQHSVLNITSRMKRSRVAYGRFTGKAKQIPLNGLFGIHV